MAAAAATELVKLARPKRRKAGSISSSATRAKVVVVGLGGRRREGVKMLLRLLLLWVVVRCAADADAPKEGCSSGKDALVSGSECGIWVAAATTKGGNDFGNDLAQPVAVERWRRELVGSTLWMRTMVGEVEAIVRECDDDRGRKYG